MINSTEAKLSGSASDRAREEFNVNISLRSEVEHYVAGLKFLQSGSTATQHGERHLLGNLIHWASIVEAGGDGVRATLRRQRRPVEGTPAFSDA